MVVFAFLDSFLILQLSHRLYSISFSFLGRDEEFDSSLLLSSASLYFLSFLYQARRLLNILQPKRYEGLVSSLFHFIGFSEALAGSAILLFFK